MINFSSNWISNICLISGLVHKRTWKRLQAESCALRERGLAQGTWNNKVSHLRTYVTFTTYFNVPDFPVDLGVVLRFIAFMGRSPLSHNYVFNIVSSVKWFASLLDPSSVDVFEKVLVSASLKGLRAQLSRPVRQKLPFTVQHLCKFYSVLDLSDPKQLAGWCAMLLAFFGCFRLSNLVPTSKGKFDALKQLRKDDVKFEKDFVLIFYKWSKTNQNSSRVTWVPISPVSDPRFDIKFYFQKLFALVKVPSDAPLFSYKEKLYHSRNSLVSLLDTCVCSAGLSPSDYSWHSFRRGAAVFAFELGLADSAVQMLGDWSSEAFKNYLEYAFTRKATIAKKIAKNFVKQVKEL